MVGISELRSTRTLEAAIAITCIVVPITMLLLVSGGGNGLAALLGSVLAEGELDAAALLSIQLLLAALAGIGVGLWLLLARVPSRTAWVAMILVFALVVILDVVLIHPDAPVRIPSIVAHSALLSLVVTLALLRRRDGL